MSDAEKSIFKWFRLKSAINAITFYSSSSSGDQGTRNQQWDHAYEDEPPNSLMRLNDDCLRHILKYSDKEDMCRLAGECTRMRPIAEQTFIKHYNRMRFKHFATSQSLFRWEICKFGHFV